MSGSTAMSTTKPAFRATLPNDRAADKGADDCTAFRAALLLDSLAAELERYAAEIAPLSYDTRNFPVPFEE